MSGRRRRSAVRSRLLRDGDIIEIDAVNGTLDVKLSDAELDKRRKKLEAARDRLRLRVLWKYAQQVGSGAARRGDPSGRAAEKSSYADI